MQDHETVVTVVPFFDESGEGDPEGWLDIGGVDQRVEGVRVYPVGEFPQFRNFSKNLAEVERPESLYGRVFLHSDGSSRVYKKDGGFLVVDVLRCHIPKSLLAFSVVVAAISSMGFPVCSESFAAMYGT